MSIAIYVYLHKKQHRELLGSITQGIVSSITSRVLGVITLNKIKEI